MSEVRTGGLEQRVLFFCRGRGRGHAVPDIEVARAWTGMQPDLPLQFASYATGQATLTAAGFPSIDLQLDENPRYLDALLSATQAIVRVRPSFVVSHEEFAALAAAKVFGLPTIMLVDFFSAVEIWVDSLRFADRIVFMERRGIFPEPPTAKGRIDYLGPVVRSLAFARSDREDARRELKLESDERVVSVIPGAWATEERAPIFDLVLPAFERLRHARKKLVWVAGADAGPLLQRAQALPNVHVVREVTPVERLMVASDVVITKANRGSTIELAALGIPSVSLSYGLNAIDEMIIPRLHSNVALNARGIDAETLGEVIESLLRQEEGTATQPSRDYQPGGAAKVAARIAQLVAEAR
jgi:UDP-N-acetylglucosamine:LPS N-acetylglucosamine transferase